MPGKCPTLPCYAFKASSSKRSKHHGSLGKAMAVGVRHGASIGRSFWLGVMARINSAAERSGDRCMLIHYFPSHG